ncbi:MAG TPA: hypothetical protein VNH46_07310, partial [Gemmatimonadales bacterium]|nr:hypothetical protein [Gemmatimonadales bacterium]
DHPDEALSWLVQADPDRGELRGWYPYWIDLTHARHLADDHQGERAAARELRRRYPDQRIGLVLEVRAVAATGDTAAVEQLLQEGAGLPPTTYWSQGAAMVVAGEEMMAHGFGQAGWPYLSRAVEWLDHQLELHPGDRPHRYWLATALYDLGDWHRAYPVALSLARDYPNRLTYRGLAAVTAARLRLPTADSLLGTPAPHQRGDHLMLRARFAAIAGDRAEALGLFNEAVQHGVDGLPWIHASAVYDLFLLGDGRASLPLSLRAGLAPFGRTPRGP